MTRCITRGEMEGTTGLRGIPHENPVQLGFVAAGEEVAVEVNLHMVDGHDGVVGVGAEVADEDEAFELLQAAHTPGSCA